MDVIYLLRSIYKEKNIVYILKPCREISQRFEGSLRQEKLPTILNERDETTIKFEFLMM